MLNKHAIVIIHYCHKYVQISKHFKLIFDNSNVSNDKQIKQNKTIGSFFSVNFSELSNFSSLSFWGKPLWNQKLLLLTASTQRPCYPVVSWIAFHFFTNFFETNFRHQNKNYVVQTISCFFIYQLSKQYWIYYVSEHLKYCTQINEYWLNKNSCLNIV